MTTARIAPLLAGALLTLSALASQASAETLNIGYQKGSGLLAVLKAQKTLERQLAPQGVDVHWYEFAAGPQLLEALNAGSIDFGQTGAPPAVFAQAAGIDLVYVGAEPKPSETETIVVSADAPLDDIAALKGHRVALQRGSSSHYVLLQALEKAGLTLSDITPVWLPPADARAAFMTGSVDAWAIWDPYLAALESQFAIRRLTADQALAPTNSFYQASRALAEQHPKLLVSLSRTLADTGAWANTHKAALSRLLAGQLGIPEEIVARWQARNHYGIMPMNDEIVQRQQQVADTFRSQGLIPRDVDVAGAVWRADSQTAPFASAGQP